MLSIIIWPGRNCRAAHSVINPNRLDEDRGIRPSLCGWCDVYPACGADARITPPRCLFTAGSVRHPICDASAGSCWTGHCLRCGAADRRSTAPLSCPGAEGAWAGEAILVWPRLADAAGLNSPPSGHTFGFHAGATDQRRWTDRPPPTSGVKLLSAHDSGDAAAGTCWQRWMI